MNQFYTVQYQAHPPLVRGVVLRPLSIAEFTEACELLLTESQARQCPYWLLDGRADENTRPLNMYEWLGEDFLPRVHRALGTVPCLAFMAQPKFWQALQAQGYANDAPTLQPSVFRAGWFIDEAAALTWLDQFRPPS
ncbi:hypothetical protein FNT36_10865 [Hymenobacter setariae]|uniref:STAS/SEC14 domain-containing protein n=1 Tax=Hymenobacter setariae TaxID=2594794 RepID=A0A558BZK7_9BACT|nr:hypothetical protein [Hymenobacter setariae]TVT41912.1 hypothetical protein FNT36_10865 [Hymenobacter setariae]